MDMCPVVTAEEMVRLESIAFDLGALEIAFVEAVGLAVSKEVISFMSQQKKESKALIFAGKGNNGADAISAGYHLFQQGINVSIVHPYELKECSKLCVFQRKRFEKEVGKIHPFNGICENAVILDGLVGTGFKGDAQGKLKEAIDWINQSKMSVISIDIPSGLSGSLGKGKGNAVYADLTLYLELPKIGFFIEKGWNHVGKLKRISFGLDDEIIQQAVHHFVLCLDENIEKLLPPIARDRHKYQSGYVIGVAGSDAMPGAAILASSAALHAGAGIVRLLHPKLSKEHLFALPPEIIQETFALDRLVEENKRASSYFIGPGIGRKKESSELLKQVLSYINRPMVIDADGLYFVASSPNILLNHQVILTPHRQEMIRLLNEENIEEGQLLKKTEEYAKKYSVIIILKGAPTWIFSPESSPIIMTYGDPGMATAGSGDVLTGIVAAMAAKLPLLKAAIFGAYLHGKSGEIAAENTTSYGMVASDMIASLPKVFKLLL